jgi:hypothetical protein
MIVFIVDKLIPYFTSGDQFINYFNTIFSLHNILNLRGGINVSICI